MQARTIALACALAGCFQTRVPAERSRMITYNALTIIAGLASMAAGYELAKHADNGEDTNPPMFLLGFGGAIGGAYLTMAGLGGIIGNIFYTPAAP